MKTAKKLHYFHISLRRMKNCVSKLENKHTVLVDTIIISLLMQNTNRNKAIQFTSGNMTVKPFLVVFFTRYDINNIVFFYSYLILAFRFIIGNSNVFILSSLKIRKNIMLWTYAPRMNYLIKYDRDSYI